MEQADSKSQLKVEMPERRIQEVSEEKKRTWGNDSTNKAMRSQETKEIRKESSNMERSYDLSFER